MTENLDAEFAQEKFGDRADGDAGGRFAGGGALEHVAGFGEVVLQGSGEVGVAGAGRGDAFVFRGIALADGQGFLPVFPVAVFELDGDGRADGHSLAHAGKNVGGVALDLHAAAAAVALLAAPEFAVDESLVDFQSGGHAGKKGDQSFAVGLSRGEVAQHKFSIVPDASGIGIAGCSNRRDALRTPKETMKIDFNEPKCGSETVTMNQRLFYLGSSRIRPRHIANFSGQSKELPCVSPRTDTTRRNLWR